MLTATKPKTKLSIAELSALYDRIYDIADRLFKNYNPCNICVENNKVKCSNSQYKYNYLCCASFGSSCKHWENGCTVKCLACKLFVCSKLLYEYDRNGIQKINKEYRVFVSKVKRLMRIAQKYGLSSFDYYVTKKEALQRRTRGGWD